MSPPPFLSNLWCNSKQPLNLNHRCYHLQTSTGCINSHLAPVCIDLQLTCSSRDSKPPLSAAYVVAQTIEKLQDWLYRACLLQRGHCRVLQSCRGVLRISRDLANKSLSILLPYVLFLFPRADLRACVSLTFTKTKVYNV